MPHGFLQGGDVFGVCRCVGVLGNLVAAAAPAERVKHSVTDIYGVWILSSACLEVFRARGLLGWLCTALIITCLTGNISVDRNRNHVYIRQLADITQLYAVCALIIADATSADPRVYALISHVLMCWSIVFRPVYLVGFHIHVRIYRVDRSSVDA